MNNIEYNYLKRKLKIYLLILYTNLCIYLIGILLFLCSSEYIIIDSLNSHGIFVWKNLNLVWIFGLIIIFLGIILNIFYYFKILKFERKISNTYLKYIKLENKYIRKWKQKIKNNLSTKLFFLNMFNIQVWLTSLKKNFEYSNNINNDSDVNKNDKLSTIIEEYYKQMKDKEKKEQ